MNLQIELNSIVMLLAVLCGSHNSMPTTSEITEIAELRMNTRCYLWKRTETADTYCTIKCPPILPIGKCVKNKRYKTFHCTCQAGRRILESSGLGTNLNPAAIPSGGGSPPDTTNESNNKVYTLKQAKAEEKNREKQRKSVVHPISSKELLKNEKAQPKNRKKRPLNNADEENVIERTLMITVGLQLMDHAEKMEPHQKTQF